MVSNSAMHAQRACMLGSFVFGKDHRSVTQTTHSATLSRSYRCTQHQLHRRACNLLASSEVSMPAEKIGGVALV